MQKGYFEWKPLVSKVAAVTGLLAAGLAVAAPTASAEHEEDVAGCISYSYEGGVASTTVYFHNQCDTKQPVSIYPQSNACETMKFEVDGGVKGSKRMWNCKVDSVGNE